MSQPKEEREFKVTITVIDEKGQLLNRNYIYRTETDYNVEVADLVDTFLETNE